MGAQVECVKRHGIVYAIQPSASPVPLCYGPLTRRLGCSVQGEMANRRDHGTLW